MNRKMLVERIRLKNFRNYQETDISFEQGVHVFSGFNAQGKTNLLEAIFLAVLGKSFRANHDDELIRWDASDSIVECFFSNHVAAHNIVFKMHRGIGRENILNGQQVRKKELIGLLNAVFFSPEDLWLIKGSPSGRRRFIDFSIAQSDSVYYQNLLRYNRILLQRNQLLKKINAGLSKRNLLDVWDEQLISLAESISVKRFERVKEIAVAAKRIHAGITNGAEDFSAHYLIYCGADMEENNYHEWFKEKLIISREKDIARGTTDVGPHKDDICFSINSYDGKMFASQGQQRTIVLSLKLAEIEIIRQITGEYPILLLDDVMSELDEVRKEKLVEAISGKIQTFITGTEDMNYLKAVMPNKYHIEEGKIIIKSGGKTL